MKPNVHTADRITRILLSIALVVSYFLGYLSGTGAIIALSASVVFALTGLIGFCPLYTLIGIQTKRKTGR